MRTVSVACVWQAPGVIAVSIEQARHAVAVALFAWGALCALLCVLGALLVMADDLGRTDERPLPRRVDAPAYKIVEKPRRPFNWADDNGAAR